MQDAKHGIVEEVCVPRVARTLEVSSPYSTFLEFTVIDFLLDLLFNPMSDLFAMLEGLY
jgi:hypothetical protein